MALLSQDGQEQSGCTANDMLLRRQIVNFSQGSSRSTGVTLVVGTGTSDQRNGLTPSLGCHLQVGVVLFSIDLGWHLPWPQESSACELHRSPSKCMLLRQTIQEPVVTGNMCARRVLLVLLPLACLYLWFEGFPVQPDGCFVG